jgi:hypothetical protein
VLVELQASDAGAWRSVRTVRSTHKGTFSYAYRFSAGARAGRYPVRARVRADGSYPFSLGTSRRVPVRVTR